MFAGKGEDKFSGIGWRPSAATGRPVLNDVLAWIDCDIETVHEAGDHWIVVGRVLDLEIGHEGGRWCSSGAASAATPPDPPVPVYALGEIEPTIDPTAYVHPDAVIIGDVRLGPESSVWPGRAAGRRGADHDRRSHVDPGRLGAARHARASHDGGGRVRDRPPGPPRGLHHRGRLAGGLGAVVLHDAVVRTGALVGAGAVVSGGVEVPARAMALGIPARIRPDAVDPER